MLVTLTDTDRPEGLLGRRANHLPMHPGEVAFPGGKRENVDATPWDTALREAQATCRDSSTAVIAASEGLTLHVGP